MVVMSPLAAARRSMPAATLSILPLCGDGKEMDESGQLM